MTGAPWQVAVIIGALLIFAAGVATALRGQDWPVMSARYDAPGAQSASARPAAATDAATAARPARRVDAATMWESLNGGEDPTDDPAAEPAAEPADHQAAEDQETRPTRQREGKPQALLRQTQGGSGRAGSGDS